MNFVKWFALKTCMALTVCLVLSAGASSQGSKGTIRGRVTDASGAALVGAEVLLQQNGASVVTDAQGQFFLNDLDPGTYTVEISYVGFTPMKKDTGVVAGQTASLDTKMEVESVNLQVLVTADRAAGEAEAVNRERNADNIVQVLPSAQ